MQRRRFLQVAGATMIAPAWLAAEGTSWIDLRDSAVLISGAATARERKAAQVLVEEAAKRCGITWPVSNTRKDARKTTIYLATRESLNKLAQPNLISAGMLQGLKADGYLLRSGQDSSGAWIIVVGNDERGLLFGVGRLLRSIDFSRQAADVSGGNLNLVSNPEYQLRGHQLGYRPKTNAYDAWDVATWDQYIRDLAVFGTNAIELIPKRSDDLPDSPHFPLPPDQMMIEMSRIADSYGLDVWIWYPALDKDYGDPATVEFALKEWGQVFAMLPRVDAVLVPGGDPGHTAPKNMLPLLEKQRKNLRQYHPKAEMWVSPQGFDAAWMDEFLGIVRQEHTKQWLDGIVFGPQARMPIPELKKALPSSYKLRYYPDITHSVQCQYPVPDWDIAYAMTEGREVINPRPRGEANLLRRFCPGTVGFLTYSEGCNDDANKFVWSLLGWDSKQSVVDVVRDFTHYFVGPHDGEGFAQGLMSLESNWVGPLATNSGVEVTLQQFQDIERGCAPQVLENWRFQQALYRAYFDAYVRRRLLNEMALVQKASNVLSTALGVGWTSVPLGIGDPPSKQSPNGLDPEPLLSQAQAILEQSITNPVALELRTRVMELGAALFQSIQMQLAVERYQGEAVERATNLDTLDAPVTDLMWMRRQILGIRKLKDPMAQIEAIRALLTRTDPGPGGYYDQLGNVTARPHLVPGPGSFEDPDFRSSPLIGFNYPDERSDTMPMAWKSWAESISDAPLTMQYKDLDRNLQYKLRVVYSGDAPKKKIRLVADDKVEVHPYIERAWPPAPQEFTIPVEATSAGELKLVWTREPGLGGNGRGCQVAEVFLIPVVKSEA
jgi:hypothetical protein